MLDCLRVVGRCPRLAGQMAAAWFLILAAGAAGQSIHQTADVTPLAPASQVPFRLELRPYDFGAAVMPTLHSYVAAEHDGQWVLFAGRTNGIHGFEQSGSLNFPVASQNREVWVIDPVSRQTWHRSFDDASSGLTGAQVAPLTSTNAQFLQQGDRLYVVGGYGANASGASTTFNVLSGIDLPGLIDWTKGGAGQAAAHIRQLSDPSLAVTGGALLELGGRMQLILGQNFTGGYVPGRNGAYTQQIRSFELVDDGSTLALADPAATTPLPEYRRRDLNVFPVLRPDGAGGAAEGVVVLSGVFTLQEGAWTVPIEIDAAGQPTMADPAAADTFKQGFNGYHSAKLGLYSAAGGEMHEILFGGISLQYRDEATGAVLADDAFPFVNDVTAVTIDAAGDYAQRHLGYFPELFDQTQQRLRYGANAEFFRAPGVTAFDNGVIDLDALGGETSLGWIYGGLVSNSPHTRGVPGAVSAASNRAFEVVLIRVPEPACIALLLSLVIGSGLSRRSRVVS